jgi:hypothetical protein
MTFGPPAQPGTPAPPRRRSSPVLMGGRPAETRWRPVRRVAAVFYVAAFVLSAAINGVPIFRLSVVAWTLGAFAVYCIGRERWMFPRALLDWLPFSAAMICYDLSRWLADRLGPPVRVEWPAQADQWLFGGTVPTMWLQNHFHTAGVVHWYDVAASLVYFSFFLAVPITMAVLWVRNRRLWQRFTATVVTLSFAALGTYVLFPEAPPWYAAQQGIIGSIDRISSLGWTAIGLRAAGELVDEGQAVANDVAAMPSLHVAYTMLVTLFLLPRVPRWSRPLIACYPLAMGLTLVYTGEHWVVDIIAGIAYATVAHFGVAAVARRIADPRAAAPEDAPDLVPAEVAAASA